MNNPAEQTAIGPMMIVAADQYEPSPLVHDPWARRIWPTSGRIAASLARWSLVRRAFIAVTERRISGGWANYLSRKRYVDDQLVSAVAKGIDAVVILGAGYDTRAYRLPALAGIPVCEVDLPGNISRKAAAVLRCFGRVRQASDCWPSTSKPRASPSDSAGRDSVQAATIPPRRSSGPSTPNAETTSMGRGMR